MGAANLGPEQLRTEIRRTKALTTRRFAVDLLAPLPEMIEPYLPVLYDEEVPIFVAGLAVPEKYMAEMKRHGIVVMVMTGKVRHAVRAEEAGADVVAAQGTEAGGHTGEIGGIALVPQVVDAVSIPVVAAGGIVDGRGLVAALALGASGAIVGTRFIATPEATAAEEYRNALVAAQEDDTIRTRCYSGKPLRSLRNAYIEEWEADPSRIRRFPEQLVLSSERRVMSYFAEHADPARTCFPAGQGVGAIHAVKPAAEVFADILREAHEVLARPPFAAAS
jgi:enoyl-[acyl-carrier protein] reductase II